MCVAHRRAHRRLQWGHGLAAVEIWRPPRRSRSRRGRFNGATASRPWRFEAAIRGALALLGFNGATASRPWRSCCPTLLRPPISKLQWGHGLAAVEITTDFNRSAPGSQASMGPRPRGRGDKADGTKTVTEIDALQWGHGLAAVEIWSTSRARTRPALLQWGHGLAAVEMGSATRETAALGPCFNGATASRPWRCAPCIRRTSTRRKLQWGHGLAAVEIGLRLILRPREETASMGPRPRGRGD